VDTETPSLLEASEIESIVPDESGVPTTNPEDVVSGRARGVVSSLIATPPR